MADLWSGLIAIHASLLSWARVELSKDAGSVVCFST